MKGLLNNTIRVVLVLATVAITTIPGNCQQAQDAGWPRQIAKDGDKLVYYQPQVTSWNNHALLVIDMAFALTPKGGQEVHGVATLQGKTLVDKESHTVLLQQINATSVRFAGLPDEQVSKMSSLFRKLQPTANEPISLDRLLAQIDHQKTPAKTVALKNDPPIIFYSSGPAMLLTVEGDSVLAPINKTDLSFVVNANWDVFLDKKQKSYYLLNDQLWLTAKALKGPWTPTKSLPKDLSKLPDGENFDDVKKQIPPHAVAASETPQVFFSNKPAELIVFRGAPVYERINGTSLLFVANTDNDIFLDNLGKKFYVLFSGRWFNADKLNGPWRYAGNELPKDFARIPDDSPKSGVLASVPGTQAAADAVLLAQVPTTAIVNKAEAEKKVKVVYDGNKADFKPIEGTTLQYAVNTTEKVIKYSDKYYLCFQAVWFVASSPNGPWKTADMVPAEIYKIPPSSPVYNVVYVVQSNPTATTVESSTSAGYFGAFVIGVGIGACIAYGTGFYHPPYYYWGPGWGYPMYRPWPATYGAGYVYNPWTGGFAGGSRVYGPYGAAGTSAWYNPATGRYGRSASVQGWYGGRTAAQSYNPYTGRYAATSQGHNAYSQWGSSVASRGGQWVQTGHVTNASGTTAGYRTSTGQKGIVHTGANGTVVHNNNGASTFAGKDGNVYRKNASGEWNSFNNKSGKWEKSVGGAGGTHKELDRAATTRQRGNFNAQRFQTRGRMPMRRR